MAGDSVRRERLGWKKVPGPHRGKLTGHSRLTETHGAASEKRCLPVPHSSGTWEEESGNILLKKFRPDGGRGLRLWGQCVLLRTRCRRSELNQHHPRVGGRRSGQEGGQGGWWVLYQDTTVVGSTTITQAFTQPIRQRWAENKLRRIITTNEEITWKILFSILTSKLGSLEFLLDLVHLFGFGQLGYSTA